MLVLLSASSVCCGGVRGAVPGKVSYRYAVSVFTKNSGLFDGYVAKDSDADECAAFLNRVGIYVGRSEMVDNSEFFPRDCARMMGQMTLLFLGEAKFEFGKVCLPENYDSWEQYCKMNRVQYRETYQKILSRIG